jgi:hypothetical protein
MKTMGFDATFFFQADHALSDSEIKRLSYDLGCLIGAEHLGTPHWRDGYKYHTFVIAVDPADNVYNYEHSYEVFATWRWWDGCDGSRGTWLKSYPLIRCLQEQRYVTDVFYGTDSSDGPCPDDLITEDKVNDYWKKFARTDLESSGKKCPTCGFVMGFRRDMYGNECNSCYGCGTMLNGDENE